MRSNFLVVSALALLAACGERAPQDQTGQGSTTPPYVRPESSPLAADRVEPVRIGEGGSNFPACTARGTTRDRVADGPVSVRSAPYEQEGAIDQLAPGARFFICSRTHDQRWFGIVYDEGGEATARCGVSRPVPDVRSYGGPCKAGWVASVDVRLDSGRIDPPASTSPQG